MNQSYACCYAELLARATKHKNRKKPLVFKRYYSNLRLCPDDPAIVEIGHRYQPSWWNPVASKGERIADEDTPFVVFVRLEPTGMVIYPRRGLEPKLLKPLLEKYPHLKKNPHYHVFEWRKYVDIGFNNMLFALKPMIRHVGTRDEFPGLYWGFVSSKYDYPTEAGGRIKATGPVRYDAINHRLLPLTDVPERIVNNDKRKQINTRLRASYKQLRVLTVMGVEVSVEDFVSFYGAEPAERLAGWSDPEQLLAFLETIDASDRQQVVEAFVRLAALLHSARKYPWYPANDGVRMAESMHYHVASGMTERLLVRVRKVLQKHFQVVRYET